MAQKLCHQPKSDAYTVKNWRRADSSMDTFSVTIVNTMKAYVNNHSLEAVT